MGLSIQLGKPEFIVNLHFLCDVLGILGSLLTAFQSSQVSLVCVESLVKERAVALKELKGNTYLGGYMMMLVKDYSDELLPVIRGQSNTVPYSIVAQY